MSTKPDDFEKADRLIRACMKQRVELEEFGAAPPLFEKEACPYALAKRCRHARRSTVADNGTIEI